MTTKLETLQTVLASSGSAVYSYEKPKDIKNCIVYKLISTLPIKSQKGILGERSRIQLTIYADTLSESRRIAEGVKTLLDLNKTNFVLGWLINDFTVKELETSLYLSYLDFYIW